MESVEQGWAGSFFCEDFTNVMPLLKLEALLVLFSFIFSTHGSEVDSPKPKSVLLNVLL